MTEYWKSNERKYCDFCKCWLSDNKASIAFHESGKRHKLNVAKRITDISRSSEKAERERAKMAADIRKMEDAAMRSYARDIHARGDFTARTIDTVMHATAGVSGAASTSAAAPPAKARQVDPMRLPGNSDDEDDGARVSVKKVAPDEVPNASLWVEGKSDEGYTYYWNVKTNDSVWEAPKEGFLSWAEYQRINEIALKQQEVQQAEEAKQFRENANEEVARFNRERLKNFRKSETSVEKQAKHEKKAGYKTQQDATTPKIGSWQVVDIKPPAPPIDLELPQTNHRVIAPVISDTPSEPPVKRFKEKTIDSLDSETISGTSSSFKKRKFAAKGNARQRLTDD